MKNRIYILLFAMLAIGFNACQKDANLDASDEEMNRMFMTMFRYQGNTGLTDDIRACQVQNTNDMYVCWYGIEGAAGYRVQMKLMSGSFDAPLMDTILGPDV